jgi:hypothetical protein
MSEQITQQTEPVADDPAGDAGAGSLAARMKRRGQQLEDQRTEIFEIPGWEDILAVELRLLGYEESRRIGQRLVRSVRDETLRELYSYADQIIAATERFYEIDGDRRTPVERTWVQLARDGCPAKLPEDLTARQAMIALVKDRRVATLFVRFEEWMQGERPQIDEEVVRDFGMTG